MKVEHHNNPWRFINGAIKHPSFGKALGVKKGGIQKLRPDKRFISWPIMPRRQLETLVGYEGSSELEMPVLEAFVARYEAKKSHFSRELMSRSLDDFSLINMKRAIDIERMMTLVKNTITEMKSIASVFSTHHKG